MLLPIQNLELRAQALAHIEQTNIASNSHTFHRHCPYIACVDW